MISYDIKYGPNELVKDGLNGYLIPKNDKEELTNKVKYLLEHPKLQQEFSKQSIALSQNYSKNNIIEKWDNALRLINN